MTDSQITIRKGVVGDLPILLDFEQGIIEAERPFDVTLKDEKISYYDIHELILSPIADVIVAEQNGQLIGSGYVLIKEAKDYFKHTQYGYLGFMFVVPEARGKGVNRLIIEEMKAWCKKRDIFEIRLEVYSENPGAIRAYEKVGFVKQIVNMRVDIRDEI